MFLRMQTVVDHPNPTKQRGSILVNTDAILFVADIPADYPLARIVFQPGVYEVVPYSTAEIAEMIRRPNEE